MFFSCFRKERADDNITTRQADHEEEHLAKLSVDMEEGRRKEGLGWAFIYPPSSAKRLGADRPTCM